MKHLVIVAAVLALLLFLAQNYISAAPFAYDEADYMYAARRGFLANYLDSPSLSFPDYVRLGLRRGSDPSQKSALSQTVRGAGDMFFYRHAHGPVYFYWLAALSHWSTNEHFVRAASIIFPVLTVCLIYAGCLWILPGRQGMIAGILATVAYVCSPAVFRTTELAPHEMFAMWFIVALMFLAKMIDTGDPRLWYGALSTTALAFGTLEVTFVLIAVVVACGFMERRRIGFDWGLGARSLLLFAAIVVLLHPATLTKLSFAKSYLYYAYLSVHRTSVWGDVTFADTWITRFSNSPVEWLLIATSIFVWIRYRDLPGRRIAIPFLLFGALMLGTMLRVFTNGARYMLPFVPAFHVCTGIVLSGVLLRRRSAVRISATALIPAALAIGAAFYLDAHPFEPDPRESLLLARIEQMNLGSSKLLVPHDDLPTIHYYFPTAELTSYTDELALPEGNYDAVVSESGIRVHEVTK